MQSAHTSDAHGAAQQGTDLPLVEIDADSCVGCGLCVRVCPTRYLTQKAPKTRPECIQCGHCVAVCPTDSIIHKQMDMDAFQPISDVRDVEFVERLLHAKRSVRHFKDKPIPREIIERLLNSAACAPTNSNSQDRAFIVLTERSFINAFELLIIDTFRTWMENELAKSNDSNPYLIASAKGFIAAHEQGAHPVFHSAPCVICAHSRENNYFGTYNCISATDYLMLHASSLGLGSCVAGAALHSPKEANRFLGLADDRRLQSVIVLGYPAIRYKRTVSRRPAQVCWHDT